MITEGMKKQVAECRRKGHRVEERGKGEVYCRSCKALVAWHVVDTTDLSQENSTKLYLGLPMRYGEDSDTVDTILLKAGLETVNDGNVEQAIELVKRKFQKDLPSGWEGWRR